MMSSTLSKTTWGMMSAAVALAVGITVFKAPEAAEPEPRRAPHELLPASTVAYAAFDGSAAHTEAWKRTAAHAALSETGLSELAEQVLDFALLQATGSIDGPLARLLDTVTTRGGSLAVWLRQPLPRADFVLPHVAYVLHDAGDELPSLTELMSGRGSPLRDVRTVRHRERLLHRGAFPDNPVDVIWWREGRHAMVSIGFGEATEGGSQVVVSSGLDAVDELLDVIDGSRPNISKNALWSPLRSGEAGYEVTETVWCDVRRLREQYGQLPIPLWEDRRVRVSQILDLTGLSAIDSFVFRSGYEGRAVRSEMRLNTSGDLAGLSKLTRQRMMTPEELPPLPASVENFWAGTFDLAAAYAEILATLDRSADLLPSRDATQLRALLPQIPELIGFDPQADLLEALGDVVCIYGDPGQGYLGSGGALAIAVKDAAQVERTLGQILNRLSAFTGDGFGFREMTRHGRKVVLLEFGPGTDVGAVCVDEEWLVIGLLPQAVDAFLLRRDGTLPRWDFDTIQAGGVHSLPEQFASLSFHDPRSSYRALLKMAPLGLSAGIGMLKAERVIPQRAELPIRASDLPPAEQVVQPLFPNVIVSTVDENGVSWTSRRSVPSVPLLSGFGSGNTSLTVTAAAAVLVPAVQQARAAARRSASSGHLKQLAIALHNYHDTYNEFPAGTIPSEKLEPGERLSWLVRILPYLDQLPLYEKIDQEAGWKDRDQRIYLTTHIPVFEIPGQPNALPQSEYAPTHYVGIAGLGKDGPTLPRNHPRAGIFAYNQSTRISQITDGTSNTMMVSEASGEPGPWASGGKSTIRALTTKPYINGPDGIGSPFPGGCNVVFADGAVRFLSEKIDPGVLEALATMAGGEPIGNF